MSTVESTRLESTTDHESSGKLAKVSGPSTSSGSLSALDSLRAPHISDLGRKLMVKVNPPHAYWYTVLTLFNSV